MSNTVFNGDDTIRDEFPVRGKMIGYCLRNVNWQVWSDFHAASQMVHALDNESLMLDGMTAEVERGQKISDLVDVMPAGWVDPKGARKNFSKLSDAELGRLHTDLMEASAQSQKLTSPEGQAKLNEIMRKASEGVPAVVMGEGLIDGETDYEVTVVDHDQHFNMT